MIALFQANTKSVERYFQQLVHANIFWVYTISCRGKRLFVLFNCLIFFDNRCWNCMFLFPWMCFETVHSNALHFETFSWLCLDSMSSRDICVSSGGIGWYLNQFIEESWFWPAPFFTPSHPFKFWPCAGSIDPTIRDTYPKASLKKDPFHAAVVRWVIRCQLVLFRFGIIWSVCFLNDVALVFPSRYGISI